MSTLWQDIRHTLRTFRRTPGLTLVMALTLALGIGVNTAVFTLFDAFAFRPVPVADPESLVHVKHLTPEGERENLLSYREFSALAEASRTLSALAAFNEAALRLGSPDGATVESNEPWALTPGLMVSGNYFSMLGTRAALGRLLGPEDDVHPGAHPVVVLGHGLWQRRFGSDPEVLGKSVELGGHPYTVVGVAAPEFVGTQPKAPDLYLPLMMRDQVLGPGAWAHGSWYTDREARTVLLLGRLRPGVTRAAAEAELRRVQAQAAVEAPAGERAGTVAVTSASSLLELDPSFLPLAVPVGVALFLVLLAACANVANLVLARATTRQREIAVRLSVGASRARLVRQLLTESLVMGLLGGALGLLLADASIRLAYPRLLARLPALYRHSFTLDPSPDARVFSYLLALSLATGVLFGLAPALQATRLDLSRMLRGEGSALARRLTKSSLRDSLLVAQVAISVVLLVSAGLLVRGLARLDDIDVGFSPAGVVAVSVSVRGAPGDPRVEARLRAALADRLRALPGVRGVAAAWYQPFTDRPPAAPLAAADGAGAALRGRANLVDADYFSTLGLRLARGRAFTREEAASGAAVAVVSETAARRLWPDGDALGKAVSVGVQGSAATTAVVVGVAADTRSGWVWEPDQGFAYLPVPPGERRELHLLVRSDDPAALLAELPREAVAVDPRLRVAASRLQDALAFQMKPFQAAAAAGAALGLLALALATVGVFGVASFLVRQRVREVGIRMALGADPGKVVRLVLGQGARPVALGLALGLAGAAAGTRVLRGILAGLSPLDPVTYLGVALLLGSVALLATLGPARWAARVDPVVALRCD